ncbi:MAG: hypothetical protein L0J53_09310, partial [Psychrobacter sp.]|nr:hypothetical protein [Psychrobacter sp.]
DFVHDFHDFTHDFIEDQNIASSIYGTLFLNHESFNSSQCASDNPHKSGTIKALSRWHVTSL